jgi:hypothetical protein
MLAGCGQSNVPTQNHVGVGALNSEHPTKAQRLYIGNQGAATITVYSTKASNPLIGTIPSIYDPHVAMSRGQQLYSSYQNRTDSVMSFDSRSLKLLATYTTNIAHPTQIVFDPSGNAYIEDRTYVVVYPNGKPTQSYKLKTKTKFPKWLAVAPDGNLYVATPSDVEIFKPGMRRPSKTITSGVADASHIAVGSSGTLYVANSEDQSCGSVSIYASGSTQPTYGIQPTKTTCDFGQIAEGPDGNVYVQTSPGAGQAGAITVYSSGNPTLLRTIQNGLVEPLCFAFDLQGNLYVSDYSESVVRIYAPGSTTVDRTISEGIGGPISLTFSQ